MKLLFPVPKFDKPRGIESGLLSFFFCLTEMDHEVVLYSPILGECAQFAEERKIATCIDTLEGFEGCDVAIGHDGTLDDIKRLDCAFRFQILHDMIGGALSPTNPLIENVDGYFAVTEQIRQYLLCAGKRVIDIIRQPIDLSRFEPKEPLKKSKPRVLYFDSGHDQTEYVRAQVQAACNYMDLEFYTLGLTEKNLRWDVQEVLNQSDLVIASTRCAIEAMACGRNVIIASAWSKDFGTGLGGFVNSRSFDRHMGMNYTGADPIGPVTTDYLVSEIEKYNPGIGLDLRCLIEPAHNMWECTRRLMAGIDRVT